MTRRSHGEFIDQLTSYLNRTGPSCVKELSFALKCSDVYVYNTLSLLKRANVVEVLNRDSRGPCTPNFWVLTQDHRTHLQNSSILTRVSARKKRIEQIKNLLSLHGTMSTNDVSRKLGCSRNAAYQTLISMRGVKLARKGRGSNGFLWVNSQVNSHSSNASTRVEPPSEVGGTS